MKNVKNKLIEKEKSIILENFFNKLAEESIPSFTCFLQLDEDTNDMVNKNFWELF